MLVLSRKVGERIVVGDRMVITVNRVSGNRVSLGIDAPPDVRIARGELVEAMDAFDEDDSRHSERNRRRRLVSAR